MLALCQDDESRIMKSSPMDSPRILVVAIKSLSRNLKGFTPSKGIKYEWGRKICNLQPISRRISEMVQDRPKLPLMTNRKSYIPFDVSTILNDQWPLHTLLHKTCLSVITTKI